MDEVALQRGRDWEEHVSVISGGLLVPGSGSQWHSKGDVKALGFLVQAKAEAKRSWALTRRELKDAMDDALGTGRPAALALLDDDGEEIFVCRLSDLLEVLSSGARLDVPTSNGETKRQAASVPGLLRDIDVVL